MDSLAGGSWAGWRGAAGLPGPRIGSSTPASIDRSPGAPGTWGPLAGMNVWVIRFQNTFAGGKGPGELGGICREGASKGNTEPAVHVRFAIRVHAELAACKFTCSLIHAALVPSSASVFPNNGGNGVRRQRHLEDMASEPALHLFFGVVAVGEHQHATLIRVLSRHMVDAGYISGGCENPCASLNEF